jgi:hypothetical protein
MCSIDWEQLAKSVGTITDDHESGSNRYTFKAIETPIGEDNINEAVGY